MDIKIISKKIKFFSLQLAVPLQKAAAFCLGVTAPLAALLLIIIGILKLNEIKFIFIQDISDRINKYILLILIILGSFSFMFTTVSYSNSLLSILFVLLAVYLYYVLRVFNINKLTVLKYYLFGISVLTFFGIYQYIFLNGVSTTVQILFITLDINMRAGRISSFIGNSNLFAGYAALGVITGLALFFVLKDKIRYFYLSLSFIAFIALLLTQSRGAIVSTVLAIMMLMVYIERKYAYGILTGLLLLIGFLVMLTPAIPNQIVHRILTTGSQDISRELLWHGATDMIKTHPLTGVGPAGFNYHFNKNLDITAKQLHVNDQKLIKYYRSVNYTDPHNTFLRIASEWGIPFALILMGFILYRAVDKLYKQQDIVIIISIIGIFMVMLMGLVDDPLASGEILGGFLLLNSLVHSRKNADQ